MKMTPEDYEQLKSDIREVCKAYGIDLAKADGGETGLKTMYLAQAIVDRNRAYDDEHPMFKDNSWKRVLPFTGRNYCHLYDKGLNDSHIATALRKIKGELIMEQPSSFSPYEDEDEARG